MMASLQVYVFIDIRSRMKALPEHLIEIPNLTLVKQDLGKYAQESAQAIWLERRFKTTYFTQGTSVGRLWRSRKLRKKYRFHHESDVLRCAFVNAGAAALVVLGRGDNNDHFLMTKDALALPLWRNIL